jgi:glycosyltransferase involved in cell wall biosynthesis
MKVLATIIIGPHLAVSGAVKAGRALSLALAKHCDIDIAVMASEETTTISGNARILERSCSNVLAFTKPFLPNRFRTLFYRSDLPSLVRKGSYDLVHIHNAIPALEMRRVARACVERGVPYVISTHGFVEVTSGGKAYLLKYPHERLAWKFFLDKALGYVVKHAHSFFALSPMEYTMLNRLGVAGDRIRVVTNGVNPAFYSRRNLSQIESVCNRFGLPKPADKVAPACIYLGNHTRNKGVEILLEGFALSKKAYILIVCGEKRNTIDYVGFSKRCGNGQRMVFTDRISEEDIISLLQYADLFVYPTLADTLPLVILEAMASGLPIISTDVGGISYQVDETFGVLVEPGNPQALKQAFEHLTQDMQQLKKMGYTAREVVRSKFDWDQSAQIAFAYYQEILGERN